MGEKPPNVCPSYSSCQSSFTISWYELVCKHQFVRYTSTHSLFTSNFIGTHLHEASTCIFFYKIKLSRSTHSLFLLDPTYYFSRYCLKGDTNPLIWLQNYSVGLPRLWIVSSSFTVDLFCILFFHPLQ